jgi:copper chaperone CopZ
MGMKETRFKVPDMSCGHCVATVQRALESLEGVTAVEVSLETKGVVVQSIEEMEAGDFLEAVQAAGFSPSMEA